MSKFVNNVLSVYKSFLKTIPIVFKNDTVLINASKQKVKEEILKKKYISEVNEIKKEIEDFKEINTFLLKNLIQGEKNARGNFFLNIHSMTELGENDSIKKQHFLKHKNFEKKV